MTAGRYRKKPVELEVFGPLTPQNLNEALEWCGPCKPFVEPDGQWNGLSIYTLEGRMRAHFGDYIVKGVKDEFYPVKPDVFAETYEPRPTDD